MVDQNKLDSYMIKAGYTQKELAKELGMTLKTYSLKKTGKGEFKSSEIIMISKILNIPKSEVRPTFLVE